MTKGVDIREWMFRYRGYTPLPFLVLMVVLARPTVASLLFGGAVVIAGEVIRFWGVSIVGAETRTTGSVGGTFLITSGPYAYVRNPLYVGNMLLYAGVGIMSLALFPWLLLAAVVWFSVQYSLIVAREEEYLASKFGAAYDDYRKQVSRFVPRATPYRSPQPSPKSGSIAEGFASERRTLQAIGLVTVVIIVLYCVQR
jgi:protein-S-isoprenylcysteine O-methyltransferase Ste14